MATFAQQARPTLAMPGPGGEGDDDEGDKPVGNKLAGKQKAAPATETAAAHIAGNGRLAIAIFTIVPTKLLFKKQNFFSDGNGFKSKGLWALRAMKTPARTGTP